MTSDPEHQSLLPSRNSTDGSKDPENFSDRIATGLESPFTHWTILSLTLLDTTLVLIDLIYTFLSPGCGNQAPDSPGWLNVLSIISTVITALFLLEIPLHLFAFGPEYYNPAGQVPYATLHIFDAIVIVTTFVLEVILKGREKELAGLLIILRLWRIIKIVSGVAVGAGQLSEEQAKRLAETEQELESMQHELDSLRRENAELRRRLI